MEKAAEVLLIPIAPGEEVIGTIARKAAEQGVKDGAVVSLIGMVLKCAVSTMEKEDATHDIVVEYSEALELSGNGEIRDGKVHIHAVLGAEGNRAVSGHLHWATTGNETTNAYVVPLG
ncbi:PCC domain-containing protein [Streptomyces virginiae]|uniref:PCC domain-containing protein n=1 Tax=Streptomyces virginiae TaxID=1961 RepID=UPI00368F11F7